MASGATDLNSSGCRLTTNGKTLANKLKTTTTTTATREKLNKNIKYRFVHKHLKRIKVKISLLFGVKKFMTLILWEIILYTLLICTTASGSTTTASAAAAAATATGAVHADASNNTNAQNISYSNYNNTLTTATYSSIQSSSSLNNNSSSSSNNSFSNNSSKNEYNHNNSNNNKQNVSFYSTLSSIIQTVDKGVATITAYTAASIYDAQSDTSLPLNISLMSNETLTDIELPPIQTILVSITLLLTILGTIVGNVLVCIAVCMVRKLRRPCNYLLVSLALSDLCVAVLVMPIAMIYEILDKWNFGPLICDIWVSFDVLCCAASILNLCAISVDRYLAITKPLEYGVKRTPRRMMLCVALVWLGAACISLPPLFILGNEHMSETGEPICIVCQNFAYQLYATLASFYIPLAVMLFVYYQIFRAAHRIVLEEKRAQTHLQNAINGTTSPPTTTDLCGTSSSHLHLGTGGNGHRHSSYGNTSLSYSGALSSHAAGSSNLLGSPHQKKLRFQLAKEKKASTTLGIIMSAFTICWLPFFILALIRPFVPSYHVPNSIKSLFLWLGYANSLLNPIIYATLNRDFRKPFQEILYFRCSSLNTMMRENYYHDQYGEPPSQRVMLGDERHGARESFL